ncbi:hypothetical protein FCV25MIE_00432 [Fagus crenata]
MALALFLLIYNLCNSTSSRHVRTSQRNTSTKEISQDLRTSRRLFTQLTQIGQNDIAAGFRTLSNEQFKAGIPDVIESHISYAYMAANGPLATLALLVAETLGLQVRVFSAIALPFAKKREYSTISQCSCCR